MHYRTDCRLFLFQHKYLLGCDCLPEEVKYCLTCSKLLVVIYTYVAFLA